MQCIPVAPVGIKLQTSHSLFIMLINYICLLHFLLPACFIIFICTFICRSYKNIYFLSLILSFFFLFTLLCTLPLSATSKQRNKHLPPFYLVKTFLVNNAILISVNMNAHPQIPGKDNKRCQDLFVTKIIFGELSSSIWNVRNYTKCTLFHPAFGSRHFFAVLHFCTYIAFWVTGTSGGGANRFYERRLQNVLPIQKPPQCTITWKHLPYAGTQRNFTCSNSY